MKFFAIVLISFSAVIAVSCTKKVVEASTQTKRNLIVVTNGAQLKNVLAIAKAGDSIVLKDGIYDGKFVILNSGTKRQPITLIGGSNAILDAGSLQTGYVLSLQANYW